MDTDVEKVVNDSEYDPGEDEHDLDDKNSEEEIIWAEKNENVPA